LPVLVLKLPHFFSTQSPIRSLEPSRCLDQASPANEIGLGDHVELAVGLDLADQDGLGDVVVGEHRRDAAGQVRRGDAGQRVDHLVGIEALGLLDRLHPHGEADDMGLHRVVGDGLVILLEGLPLLDEGLVLRRLDRLEVVPRGEMADQRLGVDAGQFFLADREGDDRDVGGLDALVAEFLVERHVGVAVDRRNHGRLLAGGAELLDVGDDRLPVGMTERRVVDHDVLLGHALGEQIGLEDLVGRARIDVVGSGQHPALNLLLLGEIVDRGDRLLVRRRAGVEDVALALLTLVLDRVEQDRVQLLEDRQHGFAGHRGPAAKYGRDLVLGDQLARLLGEERPVGGGVDHDRLELLAEHAALLVLLLDEHEHDVLQRRLGDRHRARERVEDADLDGLLRRRRQMGCKHGGARESGAQNNATCGVHG
jgi:hypothetical protein